MTVNGLHARIMLAEALSGDRVFGLPPGTPVPAYVVDEHPACPDNWEHGSDKASSYFVSLTAGKGMWFDFTVNAEHARHVAVVVSVQGLNPVTGKPITELCLVQHRKQCPVHKVDFQQDRYCPKCEYKWPAQNYIATTTGETLWIDGFRNESGTVRQYIISEEQAKGIAAQTEQRDKEFKRVWAIGFAFYISKEPKPVVHRPIQSMDKFGLGGGMKGMSMPMADCLECAKGGLAFDQYTITTTQPPENVKTTQSPEKVSYSCSATPSSTPSESISAKGEQWFAPAGELRARAPLRRMAHPGLQQTLGTDDIKREVEKVVEQKKLEIGAGAQINQDFGVDNNPIEFWQPEPVGMIYVNFTSKDTLDKILAAGKRQDKVEGPLSGMKVGN